MTRDAQSYSSHDTKRDTEIYFVLVKMYTMHILTLFHIYADKSVSIINVLVEELV